MEKTISLAGIISLIILGSCLLVMGSYLFFEPEEVRSVTATSSVAVSLTVTEEVSLTAPSAITMSPNITATQNSSIGGTSTSPWLVKTNAAAGYTLTLYATATPALQSATNNFSDAATTSPVTWGFSGGQSCSGKTTCFGFSAFGTDVSTGSWGTDSNCGSGGTPSATLKYRGFESTTSTLVASRYNVTPVAGIGTTMCVAGAQNTVYAASGNYSAVIIGTATTQ
jgi:hypothetical protein